MQLHWTQQAGRRPGAWLVKFKSGTLICRTSNSAGPGQTGCVWIHTFIYIASGAGVGPGSGFAGVCANALTHFSQGTVATRRCDNVQQYSAWGRGYIPKQCRSTPSLNGKELGIIFYLGGGGQHPPKFRSFDKAEPNSQFHGKYSHNNLIRIWVSLIYKFSGTPG
jgi:hypothetical protein